MTSLASLSGAQMDFCKLMFLQASFFLLLCHLKFTRLLQMANNTSTHSAAHTKTHALIPLLPWSLTNKCSYFYLQNISSILLLPVPFMITTPNQVSSYLMPYICNQALGYTAQETEPSCVYILGV